MLTKKRAGSIIQEYSGVTPTEVDIYPDPKIDTAYAIRCKQEGEIKTYLLTSWDRSISDADAAMKCLEEAEFDSWPPPDGEPTFLI